MKATIFSRMCFAVVMAGGMTAQASTILVEDTFELMSEGAELNGTSPSTNNSGASLVWTARAATEAIPNIFRSNGSGGLTTFTTTQSAGLQLGSGYFNTNPGLYRLSVDITYPSSASSGSSWIGVGFSQGMETTANLTSTTNNGGPWVFYRGNGSLNYRTLANNGGVISGVTLTAGTTQNIAIELDTTLAQWAFKVFVNGTQVGSTYTYGAGANPNLGWISLSSGVSGDQFDATVDNFRFELIPEPGSAALCGMAGVLALARRRRG